MIFQGFLFAVNCNGSRTLSVSPWISQTAKINSITESFWVNSFAAAKASLSFIKDRCRSNRSQIFLKISVLKNFGMFTGKHLLESLFNQVAGLQVFSCEYCKIAKSSFFIEHLRWLPLQMFCMKNKCSVLFYFQEDIAEYIVVLHCIIVSFWNLKSLSFAFIRCTLDVIRCTTRCHSLYHPLWLVVLLVVTFCHSLYHSLSFVVTRCHSLSLVVSLVSLVVTWCTTRLSFYKRS